MSKEYHKINGIFKRSRETNKFILGNYSIPEFEYLKFNEWHFTEKIDGTNIRVIWDGEKITYGGRTERAQIPVDLFNRLNEIFKTDEMIALFKEKFDDAHVCIYGEGYGAKIQKGGGNYNPDGVDFVAFDIRVGHWWLERDSVRDICHELEIDIVPVVGYGTLDEGINLVKNGIRSEWGDFIAEGIIAKPSNDLFCRNGSRIITKIKYKDFIGDVPSE